MTFVIAAIVVILTFIVGALLAWGFKGLDKAVVQTRDDIEQVDRAYNPALTLGHSINTQSSMDEQVKEARRQAARRAAALPRGANMNIKWKENPAAPSASGGVEEDPWTAAKIAQFHGWDGARTGIPAGGVPVGAAAVATAGAVAAAPGGPIELVPGKDYPYIEITDDMPADEKRKARIANSKAKSAAMKKAKAAGVTAAAPATAQAAAPAAAAPSPVALGITPPVLTEITDDMPADEIRKARIANSKAKSAFNKSLKAAGIDPKTVEIDEKGNIVMPAGAAAAATSPSVAATPAAPTAASVDPVAMGIEPPTLIEITDDMPADEVRKARIANSKAKSAFNKSLKAAGIDPKSVEIDEKGNVVMPQASAPTAALTAAPAPEQPATAAPSDIGGSVDFAALGISPPAMVEITDDMSPDEIRQARIANSKAKSAFNKELKAAGIDPKSVQI